MCTNGGLFVCGRHPAWQEAHDGAADEDSAHDAGRPGPDPDTITDQQTLASRLSTESKPVLCREEFQARLRRPVLSKLVKGINQSFRDF